VVRVLAIDIESRGGVTPVPSKVSILHREILERPRGDKKGGKILRKDCGGASIG